MNDSGPDPAQAMWRLMAAARTLEDRIEGGLTKIGVSTAKLGVLTELVKAGEPLTLGELASRIKCVRSNVTQLVDRLEADGLVRRTDAPDDRRSILAELTAEGRRSHKEGTQFVESVQREFAKSVPASDRAALMAALAGLK
jgi:DNA-binding MarR family transcriptional regulator